MLKKVSDIVFEFVAKKGVKDVFVLSGGGCIHLLDSLGRNKDLNYIPMFHEQAVSISTEGYAQYTNNMSVSLVTSGPGSTNAITGITAGWIDSTPMLMISGQAKRDDLIGDRKIRQSGSQEVEIVKIVTPITKYAYMVTEPNEILYHLEKAHFEATTGRPGPVWIDIPLDVQGAMVETTELLHFDEPELNTKAVSHNDIEKISKLIKSAKRPLILAGNGVKLSGSSDLLSTFIEKNNIPVINTWKTLDMFDFNDKNYFGAPGIMGHRYTNFILQNADLLIILGSRVDKSMTAFNERNFAKNAEKVIVDIDINEINKLDMDFTVSINANVHDVIELLSKESFNLEINDWRNYCKKMKDKYPITTKEHYDRADFVDTYAFIDTLSDFLTPEDVIVPESSGQAGEVTYQAFKIKKGQKMRNAAGLGSMGFGLPYAIGASLATKNKTILINGDGAFTMNIQELQTVVTNELPIKIFIWDNNGYASITNTQRNMFDGFYVASEASSGLKMPNIANIATAFGLETFAINNNSELYKIKDILEGDSPSLTIVKVSETQVVSPRVASKKLDNGSMMSMPLENMSPYLPEEEISENMISDRG